MKPFSNQRCATHCLVATILLFLISCAPSGIIQPPADRPSRDELILQLNLGVSEFRTIRGMAKSTYRQNGGRQSARQVVLAQYPDKLRLETLGLFGSPVLIAATDGKQSTVLLPGEGRAYTGSSDSGFLSQFLHLPLTSEDIIAIILLRPELIVWQNADISYLDTGISRLILTAGRVKQEIDFNQNRQIVRIASYSDGTMQIGIHYDDYVDAFPRSLKLQLPLRLIEASLNFSDIELNIDHKEGLFKLVPPAEYVVEPIPAI